MLAVILINNYMKPCPKCQTLFEPKVEWGIKKFCSKKCANSRGPRSEEFKIKVSNKLRKKFNRCIICNNLTKGKRKTCSSECLLSFKKTQTPPKHPGGYRKGSGRGKHGWYKNFYLDSTYELAYLIYCLDHNINIQRNKKFFNYYNSKNQIRKFYPDFLVEGKLIEIKGYYVKDLDFKLKAVDEPLQVLFPKDLTNIFQYVENKTGLKIKNLYQLYEK